MYVNPIGFVYYLIASIEYYLSADHGNPIAPHGSQWALIFDALLAAPSQPILTLAKIMRTADVVW
jgi:hypothetical protein